MSNLPGQEVVRSCGRLPVARKLPHIIDYTQLAHT